MSQEMRPDGSIDTSYYTRDTGKRLNSLAAVLRYLRVRLPAHTRAHTHVPACPGAAGAGRVQGGRRQGRSGGGQGTVWQGGAGACRPGRAGAATRAWGPWVARAGTGAVRCGCAMALPTALPHPLPTALPHPSPSPGHTRTSSATSAPPTSGCGWRRSPATVRVRARARVTVRVRLGLGS